MKYIVRKPDDTESTMTREQLCIAYNNRTINMVWPAKPESSSSWVRVGDVLGIPMGEPGPGTAREQSSGAPTTSARNTVALMRRYADAYGVAKAAVVAGNGLKTLGAVIGALVVLGVLLLASQGHGGVDMTVVGEAVVAAAGIGIPIWVLGLLLAAVGQLLKATLDGAVQGSPFLEKDEMAKVMCL